MGLRNENGSQFNLAPFRGEDGLGIPLVVNDDSYLGGDIDDARIIVVEQGQGDFAGFVRIRNTALNWCARVSESLLESPVSTAECDDSDPLQASAMSFLFRIKLNLLYVLVLHPDSLPRPGCPTDSS